MGSLLEFRPPNRTSRAVFGLSTRIVERESTNGRRAILEIDDFASLCVVAEIPAVGDVIHGPLTAVVEKVRVTREGHVCISARRVTLETESSQTGGTASDDSAGGRSPRVDAVLHEMRRRRLRT